MASLALEAAALARVPPVIRAAMCSWQCGWSALTAAFGTTSVSPLLCRSRKPYGTEALKSLPLELRNKSMEKSRRATSNTPLYPFWQRLDHNHGRGRGAR